MMEAGLENEVRALLDMGLSQSHTSMQAIGYKELISAVCGDSSLQQAVDKIKQESRRYAKRQLSWLRRDHCIKWILWKKVPNIDDALQRSTAFLFQSEYNETVTKQNNWGGAGNSRPERTAGNVKITKSSGADSQSSPSRKANCNNVFSQRLSDEGGRHRV